ncbi:type I secretion system permease/ATPase [Ramlibacter sp.]|uniref:type I secretion system permease/ATPase n=1 Tax=Ramlibacter sp. TaxID=1917967 RepID=UPI002C533E6F|nr:type I secretion system permease/ATPase [Ramlibacter sp.]HWI84500.1 type I secretion system permease/ATPase [Ramlibacter sp.]
MQKSSELKDALLALTPYFRRAFWFSIVATILVLAPTGYMLEVYDRVVNSRSYGTLAMLTAAVLGALIVMEVLEWSRAQILHAAGLELDRRLGDRVFSAVFAANLRRLPGGTTQPVSDFRVLRDFLQSPAVLAAMEVPIALAFAVLIFAMSPVLGWVAVVGAILQTFVGWLNERATQPPLVAANRSAFAAQQYADGTLRNAQVIEAMGMQRDIHQRWAEKQREFLTLQAVASDRAGGYQSLTKFFQTTMGSLLMGVAAWLLLHNELNGGSAMLIMSSILGGRMLAPLVAVVTQWRSVVNVRDSYGRLNQLLASVPAPAEGMPLPPPRGMLQVESVIATAPNSSIAILRGVTFGLQPGEVLAVVGPSASGKTTLARALVGLWPSAGGKVRLDGADVYTWDKAELGPHIGYLPQGVELFDGTLAENIARFGTLEPQKVEAAARAVGLHELIMGLPDGYETQVGREGAILSGGQRQRVGLARAIYGDPVFVVLDEPNSSLDEAGDAALAAAVLSLKARGTTFVVMTHRTSILPVVDKMLVLRDGQVQAFGPRDDVLAALNKAAQQMQQQPPRPAGGAVATA